jgi:hypothetical protein
LTPQKSKNSGLRDVGSDLTPDRSESSTDPASMEQLSGLTGPTFDRNFDVIWRFHPPRRKLFFGRFTRSLGHPTGRA